MTLKLLPKHVFARNACYLILVSILLLCLFYVLDLYVLSSQTGFLWFLLNIISVVSWIVALCGTILGICAIYRYKDISIMLLLLLVMGVTYSLFGLFDLILPTP